MSPFRSFTAAVLILGVARMSLYAEVAEPLLGNPPPGVQIVSSTEVNAAAREAIGKKLGGAIKRLTNSTLQVQGATIQVNVIVGADEASATTIEAALSRNKSAPFLLRKGDAIIEYAGNKIDASLATKTSFELGLLPKPDRVRYRITAELAPIDKADYMTINPLFNQLLSAQSPGSAETEKQIADSIGKFVFGKALTLRSPELGPAAAKRSFVPAPKETKTLGDTIRMEFGELPKRHGIPYVTATFEMEVDATGLSKTVAAPDQSLIAATPLWPVDDPEMKKLAQAITKGKSTNGEKADAILNWLTPGKNIRYSGQVGSRWGAAKVVSQKFGHCWDFSDCFVTLSRAVGVPSRQVAGWLYGTSGHVWAEYYVEGKSWQQVDPTGGTVLKCGIYHIPYFTTADGEMPILYLSMPKIEILPKE